MSISFKGALCSLVFILCCMPLIMQITFYRGVLFDPFSAFFSAGRNRMVAGQG